MGERLKLLRTIVSVNQLSIYGAVSDLCEECKTCHVRTGRPIMAGQSDPLFVPTSSLMKTPTPSTDDPAKEDLLQKYQEPVERLSQQNRVIFFVLMQGSWQRLTSDSASWQKTLKNSHNLQSQWLVGSTLCQEMKNHLTRKVGFEETPKLGPYWKSQWENYSSIAYSVSKQLSTLLRHGHLPREDDGAIEFWRLKDYLRNLFEHSQHWSNEMWKSTMARGGGNKKTIQYCTDPSGQEINSLSPCSSRSFRTQSHWSFITGHCINSQQFLRVHLSHRMCNQFTYTPSWIQDWYQRIVSRSLSWWKLEKSCTRKYLRPLDLLRRILLNTIGCKNRGQKLLEEVKTPNKPNQKSKTQMLARETCEEWALCQCLLNV